MFSFFKRKNGRHAPHLQMGEPETTQTAPAHTPGVKQGNARGNLDNEKGIVDAPDGDGNQGARATAQRSTGINPEARNPIDPRMPNLPPP